MLVIKSQFQPMFKLFMHTRHVCCMLHTCMDPNGFIYAPINSIFRNSSAKSADLFSPRGSWLELLNQEAFGLSYCMKKMFIEKNLKHWNKMRKKCQFTKMFTVVHILFSVEDDRSNIFFLRSMLKSTDFNKIQKYINGDNGDIAFFSPCIHFRLQAIVKYFMSAWFWWWENECFLWCMQWKDKTFCAEYTTVNIYHLSFITKVLLHK